MRCPGCSRDMKKLTVEAVLDSTVDVFACLVCRGFWFEPFETLHLTRQSTLDLFQLISSGAGAQGPFPTHSFCPVCGSPLLLSHDRQKTTPFQYWRCDAGHGRFTPFIDFLREKEFVKPLTPQQVVELRETIRMIRCSGCGASIDLAHETVCSHCGGQVSMLDPASLRQLAAAAGGATAPKAQPQLPQSHCDLPALMASHSADSDQSFPDAVLVGLKAFGRWLLDGG